MQKKFYTKRQHYVPRFLLRNFSPDGRSISMLVLKTGKRVAGASLAGQCYGDYFYGDDGSMELAFGQEEAFVSALLKDTTINGLNQLNAEQLGKLRQFVHWQRARTQGMVDQLNCRTNTIFKSIMKEIMQNNQNLEFSPEDLDLVEMKLTNPQNDAIYYAAGALPLMFDMMVKFIIAPKGAEFIISDHPVTACNQFVENNSWLSRRRGWTGLAIKGLQLFMPISPFVSMAVYDSSTYNFGSPKSVICHAGKLDISRLNRLQAINAVSCIYFSEKFYQEELDIICSQRVEHRPARETEVSMGPLIWNSDGTGRQKMAITGVDLRIQGGFSFVRILDKKTYRKYDSDILPIRNKQLLELARRFSAHLDRKVEEGRAKRGHGDRPDGPPVSDP